MLSKITRKIFGSRNDRIIKNLTQRITGINQLEAGMQALGDEQLQQKTSELKQRFEDGETLEQLLDEAFAVCREASVRVLGMRHYDVQLIGAMILNSNQITEMRTFSGRRYGFGNVIDIAHGNGYTTRYAHNSRLLVSVGVNCALWFR